MSKKKQKGISIRMLIPMVAVVLLLGCAIGGTIAWLTAQTDPVTNTFTVGNIDIELWEWKYDPDTNELVEPETEDDYVKEISSYKIVPGRNLPKRPFVVIKEGSEPCWIFIKVDKNNFIDGLSYNIRRTTNYWIPLKDAEGNPVDGVYYQDFSESKHSTVFDENHVLTQDMTYFILIDDMISVDGSITKEDLASIKDKEVSLSFTAYAVQREGFDTAAAAWEVVKSTYLNTTPAVTPAE